MPGQSGTSEQRILALETLAFDPEIGVSHLMCLAGPPRDLADLETDDEDNFLLLNLTPSEVAELIAQMPPLKENVRMCALWASSIDDMFEPGHTWGQQVAEWHSRVDRKSEAEQVG